MKTAAVTITSALVGVLLLSWGNFSNYPAAMLGTFLGILAGLGSSVHWSHKSTKGPYGLRGVFYMRGERPVMECPNACNRYRRHLLLDIRPGSHRDGLR